MNCYSLFFFELFHFLCGEGRVTLFLILCLRTVAINGSILDISFLGCFKCNHMVVCQSSSFATRNNTAPG